MHTIRRYDPQLHRTHTLCALGITSLGILFPILMMSQARAEPEGNRSDFSYRTQTQFRLSHDRKVNTTELWAPIWQQNDHLLFGSARIMNDDADNFEGNLGLGYREFFGDYIIGAYGYADRRVTPYGSTFWQGTVGGEYMTEAWEARANIYLPQQKTYRYITSPESGPYVAGTGVYIRSAQNVIEEAQPGLDAEVGFKLPPVSFLESAYLYGGVYAFDGDETASVTGIRGRLHMDVTEWLSAGSRVQYDDERGSQVFFEVTLKWPVMEGHQNKGLWGRMAISPERDIDVVTGNMQAGGSSVPLIDQETGSPLRILYVDSKNAESSGDGSAERPFAGLNDALVHAQPYDTIYINEASSSYTDISGYHISIPHVTVMGAGVPLVIEAGRYRDDRGGGADLVLRNAGIHPLLTSQAGDVLTIAADDAKIRGLQIDGGEANGIRIMDTASSVSIEDVYITGHAANGIAMTQGGGQDMNLTIRNTVITGNKAYGILLENTSGNRATIDAGTSASYGQNDIAYNIAGDVYINTPSDISMSAMGNYWGSDTPRLTGAGAGVVLSSVYVDTPFCTDCFITSASSVRRESQMENTRIAVWDQEIPDTLKGHRYIQVYGDGAPDFSLNGDLINNTDIVRVEAGDHISASMTTSTIGLNERAIHIYGAGIDTQVDVQNRFLPNVFTSLVGWWDGYDLDGDFTANNPGIKTEVSIWGDKSGYGHDALSSVGESPLYDPSVSGLIADAADDQMSVANSFVLSALGNNGLSAFIVMDPADIQGINPGTPLFKYGTCTGALASRCVGIYAGPDDDILMRVDTSSARHQTAVTLTPDAQIGPGLLTLTAQGGSSYVSYGQNDGTGTYLTGSGLSSNGGAQIMGPINGTYHEVLLFSGALSDTDRTLVTDYLSHKWGL